MIIGKVWTGSNPQPKYYDELNETPLRSGQLGRVFGFEILEVRSSQPHLAADAVFGGVNPTSREPCNYP
jgi:hypothetical protein